jgi:hypothetical protein
MIVRAYSSFVADETSIHIAKELDSWYQLFADITCMTEQFRDFQMTIMQEAIASIIDHIEVDDVLF